MPLNFFKTKKPQENTPENEEGIETGNANPLPKEQENQQLSQVIDIKAKEAEIAKKKKRFFRLLRIVIISALILIFTPVGKNIYKTYFLKPEPIIRDSAEVDQEPEVEIPNPEAIVEYSNDDLKLSLDYLYKAKLLENVENTDLTKRIEIIYDKNNNETTGLSGLSEGYIFRVSTFVTTFRDIDDIARVKKEAFVAMCPETAKMSDTIGSEIDKTEGRTFEVSKCNADYKVSYIVKNGLNYEFAQIFKGDLGYRQLYKEETENILRSVKFYQEDIDLGPTETYTDNKYRVSFEYPRSLDSKCCNITGAISESPTVLLTLGRPDSYVDENNLDAIAFFVDSNKVGDFNAYVEKQKSLLTEDYLITMGQSPTPEIRSIKVGDREGILLRGYSWRNNDLIYVDITQTDQKQNQVLVISIENTSGDSFEGVTDSILKSVEFF